MLVRGPEKYGGRIVDLPEKQARALIAAGIYKAVKVKPKPEAKQPPEPEPGK